MSQENLEKLRAVFEEWGKGNFQAGSDLFDRHVVYIPAREFPESGAFFGADSRRDFMTGFLRAWTNLTMTGEEFIEADNSVVVWIRQQALGRESGVASEMRYFQVWTFRGGSVIRVESFDDRAEALEAVGLSE